MRPVEESPRSGSSTLSQLDAYAERLRVQVPAAPPNILDGYVRFAPWVSIIVGGLLALSLLSLLGVAAAYSPFISAFAGYYYSASIFQTLLFGLALTALDIAGGYLMLQRKLTGWWLVAAAIVVYLLQDLLTASILGLLITLLIAYIHIQVKPRYS